MKRRASHVPGKCIGKVAASRKPGCQRNLKNALIRVGQQILSHAHPVGNKIIHRGLAQYLLKIPAAFAGADTGRPGDILQPYLPGILLVDKRKAGTDPSVWNIGLGSLLFPF